MLLCEKTAVQGLLLRKELISLCSIKPEISEDILDLNIGLAEIQPYFTKYTWASIEKKGKQWSNLDKIACKPLGLGFHTMAAYK